MAHVDREGSWLTIESASSTTGRLKCDAWAGNSGPGEKVWADFYTVWFVVRVCSRRQGAKASDPRASKPKVKVVAVGADKAGAAGVLSAVSDLCPARMG